MNALIIKNDAKINNVTNNREYILHKNKAVFVSPNNNN